MGACPIDYMETLGNIYGNEFRYVTRRVKLIETLNWESLFILSRLSSYRSGFTTIPPELLQEQPTMVLFLEGFLVSWSLAMDERGGHEDLCGSGRQSVMPYVHGRTKVVLLKPALSETAFSSRL
jgi:hypothetical protein